MTEEQKEKRRLAQKKFYDKNKEKIKEENKIKYKTTRNEYHKKYQEINKEKIKAYRKENYLKNKEVIDKKNKEYQKINKEKYNKYQKEYKNNRMNNDILFKISCNLRCLIKYSFKSKGYKKNSKTEKSLGCTFEEFKIYLESKFEPWMNWENYGNPVDGILDFNKNWDIDHIVPMSIGKTEEELNKLNHYTNLQPLCSKINRQIKKDRLDYISYQL
jgi:hypothetical protein